MKILRHKIAFFLIATAIAPQTGAADKSIGRGDTPPRVVVEGGCVPGISFPILLYDNEHHAGSAGTAAARSDTDGLGILGEHTSFYGPNSLVPIEMQWTDAYFDSPDPLGTGYIGLHTSAFTNPFVSFGTQHCAGAFAPAVGVPVQASSAEFGLANESLPSTIQVSVTAYIGDKSSVATSVDHWINLSDLIARNLTIEAHYLPGNALESIGMQAESYSELNSGEVWALWGLAFPPQSGMVTFNDEQIPLGPMRLFLKVDGYQADCLDLTITGPRRYFWTALLTPNAVNPGPSATDLLGTEYESYPSQKQRDRLLLWAVTGVAEQFTNLESKLDQNADAIWDAADLVHNSMEETGQ